MINWSTCLNQLCTVVFPRTLTACLDKLCDDGFGSLSTLVFLCSMYLIRLASSTFFLVSAASDLAAIEEL